LYLAQTTVHGQTHYSIRESYLHQNRFLSRNLFDIGTDPAQYIVYPGGNSFYIHESIEEQLNDLNVYPKNDELEDIFWRFLDPTIRRALETFRNRQKNLSPRKGPKATEKVTASKFHIFDQRRILYLRCGRMNQQNITCVPHKLFQVLTDKSRDEIEQMLMEMEKILTVREYKTYAYVIFNLQDFFTTIDRTIRIVVNKDDPAILPVARAAGARAALAKRNGVVALYRFAAGEAERCIQFVDLRCHPVVLNGGRKTRHGKRQQNGRNGQRDEQVEQGKPPALPWIFSHFASP